MSKVLPPSPSWFPQYDALYVVSDLHLGGTSGFQIFDTGEKLEGLIKHLRSLEATKKVALVINGDMVDFLAEKPALAFAPSDAVAKLDRIVADPSFVPVWKALKQFTATKNRYLIVNLGNHDLELALPWVRTHLLDILSGGDDAARGRITLSFEGTGYRCRVGNAHVLCVHGNEVDDWNLTNHEKIRSIAHDVIRQRPIDEWIPNAGTQMVINVMNDLKAQYPFIDLLKPEQQAVIPTILALGPDLRDKILAIAATASRLFVDKVRRATGLLGGQPWSPSQSADFPAGAMLLGANVPGGPVFSGPAYANDLLQETEERLKQNVDPMDLVSSDQRGEYLGVGSAIRKIFRREEVSEVLREALQRLDQDRSFDPTAKDETYTLLDEQVGGDVEIIIAGHTHLERSLPRGKKRGWYFNSGTWVRLIQLTPDVLRDAAAFRTVFNAFKAGDMETLDRCPGLVDRKLTVVALWSEDGRTHGELRHVVSNAGLPPRDDKRKPDYTTPSV